MNCPSCNVEVLTGGKFCRKCGSLLPTPVNQKSGTTDEIETKELVTAAAQPAGQTSGSLDMVPQTERVTNDLLNSPRVSISKPPSQNLSPSSPSMSGRRKAGLALAS